MSPAGARGKKATPPEDTDRAVDEQVIALRSDGASFAAIAKEVGVEKSLDAFMLFATAVAARSPKEQQRLRAEESARLDALETRTKRRPEGADRTRKLASIRKLRQRLAAP